MKTIQKGDQVKRVGDVEAHAAVKKDGWSYCPKKVLKDKEKLQ